MAVLLHADLLSLADQVREVDDVPRRIGGIGPDPLDVAQPALAVLRVVAAMARARRECLLDVVGDEDGAPARPAVDGRGLEDGL